MPGHCAWPIPVFDIPMAIVRGQGPIMPVPYRDSVFKDTNAETCKCWKPK
jgi:hypothetical protein